MQLVKKSKSCIFLKRLKKICSSPILEKVNIIRNDDWFSRFFLRHLQRFLIFGFGGILFQGLIVLASGATHAPSKSIEKSVRVGNQPSSSPSPSVESNIQTRLFKDTFERSFPVTSAGEFRFTNLRGPLRIEGWSQNKIHVKVERRAQADSEESASEIFRALDLRYQSMGYDVELAAQYGKGLKIQERLKEREEPKTEMALTIYAPARRKLRVWVGDSEVEILGWENSVDVRSNRGPIRVEKISAGFVKLSCSTCSMVAKNIRANFRGISGGGNVEISNLTGDRVYVETTSGEQSIQDVKGGQLYVSRTGKLQAKNLSGRVEFHTRKGNANFENCSGFMSGDTESGNVNVHYRSLNFWKTSEHSFFESDSGNIRVDLSSDFQGIIEAASQKGEVSFGFPLQPVLNAGSLNHNVESSVSAFKVSGRVGHSDRFLQISSRGGGITVLRHD